jgi:peptidoglycan-associated lipoprotein
MKRARLLLFSPVVLSLALVAALTFVSGCKAKAPKNADSAKPAPVASTEVRPPTASPTDVGSPMTEDAASKYLKDTFYDYDAATLRDDARTALAADAEWLKRHPAAKVVIEGHCDERGTDEYNLSLGDRRANAAKEYLEAMGIDESRFKTASYGRARPFCTDESETCYQENRRAHFLVSMK